MLAALQLSKNTEMKTLRFSRGLFFLRMRRYPVEFVDYFGVRRCSELLPGLWWLISPAQTSVLSWSGVDGHLSAYGSLR